MQWQQCKGAQDLDNSYAQEDGLHDGAEPAPYGDTDADGLPDGRVSFSGTWKGEDLNNNGVRDKDANDEWNETDFLANDSDVDGVLDGAEVNGTYCFKGGSCANSAHPLLPLNADTDADGLCDCGLTDPRSAGSGSGPGRNRYLMPRSPRNDHEGRIPSDLEGRPGIPLV